MRFFLTIVATLVLGTPAAHASHDHKNYPGMLCTKASGFGSVGISNGRVYNTSATYSLTVNCPITRDRFDSDGITDGSEVWVSDGHAALDITCKLISGYNTSSSTSYHEETSSGTGYQVLWFDGGGIDDDDSHFYYLSCVLPVTSGGVPSYIVAYEIEEDYTE
jgi:hypothetical protein